MNLPGIANEEMLDIEIREVEHDKISGADRDRNRIIRARSRGKQDWICASRRVEA